MNKDEVRKRFEDDLKMDEPDIEFLKVLSPMSNDGIARYTISGEFSNGDMFLGDFVLQILMRRSKNE